MDKEVEASLKLQKDFDQLIKQGVATKGSSFNSIDERLTMLENGRKDISERLQYVEEVELPRVDNNTKYGVSAYMALVAITAFAAVDIIKHFVDIKIIFK